jgi:RNA polymerase sigma-70 factor (ECF subfamily)
MLKIWRRNKGDYSDEELLNLYLKSDDLSHLGILYERYMELVFGVCLKYFKDQILAEDAVMNIFEEVAIKVKKHEIAAFRGWLYVLSRNHCLMQLRKSKNKINVDFPDERMQSSEEMHPLEEVSEEEKKEKHLTDCLEELSIQQKDCVNMFYYQGYSYKEIAEMQNEAVGKIRSNIQNGRRNLKKCIENKS